MSFGDGCFDDFSPINMEADLRQRIAQLESENAELREALSDLLHRIDGPMVFITTRERIIPEYGPRWIAEATDKARALLAKVEGE